jgi:pimeloyl-ACP methyl ester carboxylesterase
MTSTTLQLSDPFGTVSFRRVGHGEPLVLIHGVGMQSAAWDPQTQALARTHNVIAVDMPGHGGSDCLARTPELPDYVTWLNAFVTGLGCGPVNVAGHSMGALIAGGFAARYPHLTRRVAVLNGVGPRPPGARRAVEARAAALQDGVIDTATPLDRWFGNDPCEDAPRSHVATWLNNVNPQGYADAYGAFSRGDDVYSDQWPNVSCPMLALTADRDQNSTPEMARWMASQARNGTTCVIKGHRHMVNLTAPDAVTKALQNWLNQPEQQVNQP